MKKVFLKGLTTGLILQAAVGPVFFFLMNITLRNGFVPGFAAVIAVTLVDYLYIALAVAGVGKLLEKPRVKRVLGFLSAGVLIVFGFVMIKGALAAPAGAIPENIPSSVRPAAGFLSAFALTISSPLTVVFWTGVFASRSIEYNLSRKELLLFGFSAGFATLLFLSAAAAVFGFLRTAIPEGIILWANLGVGALLILYGAVRFVSQAVPQSLWKK